MTRIKWGAAGETQGQGAAGARPGEGQRGEEGAGATLVLLTARRGQTGRGQRETSVWIIGLEASASSSLQEDAGGAGVEISRKSSSDLPP